MLAEQTTSSTFWLSEQQPTIEIRLTLRLQTSAAEEYVSVVTGLLYEPLLPEPLKDIAHSKIYDGVHRGIALTNAPLPPGGVEVRVLALSILPLPGATATEADMERIASVLQVLTGSSVAALLAGLSNLR